MAGQAGGFDIGAGIDQALDALVAAAIALVFVLETRETADGVRRTQFAFATPSGGMSQVIAMWLPYDSYTACALDCQFRKH